MKFFVRIELHHAGELGYASLHRKMEEAGYSRHIVGSAGMSPLPSAMYVREAGALENAEQEQARVRIVAESVEQAAWVLVMYCSDWAGYLQINRQAA